MKKLLLGLSLLIATTAMAQERVDSELRRLLAGGTPQSAGLTMDVPEWVEDGAFVPVTVRLDGAEPPVQLLLLRSAEEDPRIARLRVHAWQPPLRLSTRVRLPQSQALIVAARDAQGRTWHVEQPVAVYGSSCLAPAGTDHLAGLGEIKVWAEAGDGLELRSLLRHPMESGRRVGPDGALLPRRLLRAVGIGDATGDLLDGELFEGLAANPLLRVVLPPGRLPLQLHWDEADGQRHQAQWPSPEP